MSTIKISIDRDSCAACDICQETAPNTFEMDEESKARVKNPSGDPKDVVISAAEGCPMNAIVVQDGASGTQLFPKP